MPIEEIPNNELNDAMERALHEMRARMINPPRRPRPRPRPVPFENLPDGRVFIHPPDGDWFEPMIDDKEFKDIIEDENMKIFDCRGKTQLKKECIIYRGEYFHNKDVDVYLDDITDKYEHVSTKSIYTKKLSINPKTGGTKKITGNTHYTNVEMMIPYCSHKHGLPECRVMSIEDITGWDCKESSDHGNIVDADYKEVDISTIKHYDTFRNRFSKDDDTKTQIKTGQRSPSFLLTEGLKMTFGIEMEVSRGYLPARFAYKFNTSCVRDGSLNAQEGGAEYVTGILVGDTGFNHLQEICSELVKRTKVDSYCGLHVHLGGVDFSKQLLVNSYMLYCYLEKEVLSMLPKSRRKNEFCKVLKKFDFRIALNKESMSLDEDYLTLWKYMSYGSSNGPDRTYNNNTNHPLGAKCGYNKNTPRYCWVNYVPAMFNTRGNHSYSLEIRNHSGTVNFNKIKNWTLIQMAILAFADNYPQLIKPKITLEEVINKIYPKRAKLLINYIEQRKEQFLEEDSEHKEYNEVADRKQSIKELCV
mgnify:CR=1 FL=1